MPAIEPFIDTVVLKLKDVTGEHAAIRIKSGDAEDLARLLNAHFARLNREQMKRTATCS